MTRRTALLIIALIWISNSSFAQNFNDTIERILIKPPSSNRVYTPPCWPPGTPYPWVNDWNINWAGNYLIFDSKNLCGEKFHTNGSIASRCECDSDSTLHGKSVYWNEYGFITNVYLYKKGRVYKEKHYYKGKISRVKNYAYNKEGSLFNHGKQITIDNEFKTVETYHFGKLHGPTTKYESGIKYFEVVYSKDVMTSEKTWNLTGQLTLEKTHNLTSNIDSLRSWNKEGKLIKTEQTVGGSREGEWMIYSPETDEKQLTTYKDGGIQGTIAFRNNNLYSKGYYKDGQPKNLVTFYNTGEKYTELIHLGYGQLEHVSWSKRQEKIEHYTTQDDYLLDEGYYLLNDSTTAFFKAPRTIEPLKPVVRVLTSKGDTLRKDYLTNSAANRNKILLSECLFKFIKRRAMERVRQQLY